MSIIFPKPLPPISKESHPDQTGFTESEKVTLRNIWRVIKRHQQKHARNIFIELYSDREEMLEHFRGPQEKFNMHSLHMHPKGVLDVYDRLVEEGLNNYAMFHIILSEVSSRHVKMLSDQTQSAIEKQVKACQEYFERVIKDVSSPTGLATLQKLSDVIMAYLI